MDTAQLIKLLGDRPVAYHPALARALGSVTAAVLVSQFIYWTARTRPDGWFWKDGAELGQETGLTRWEQDGARKRLTALGILQTRRRGFPRVCWFHLDLDALATLLATTMDTVQPPPPPVCGNSTMRTNHKVDKAPPGVVLTSLPTENTINPPTPQGGNGQAGLANTDMDMDTGQSNTNLANTEPADLLGRVLEGHPGAKAEMKARVDRWQGAAQSFDRFWEAYPKRVKRQRAWARWCKLKPDAALVERILADVATRAASWDWTKDQGQFTPHPSTYLADRGWEDEAPKVAKASAWGTGPAGAQRPSVPVPVLAAHVAALAAETDPPANLTPMAANDWAMITANAAAFLANKAGADEYQMEMGRQDAMEWLDKVWPVGWLDGPPDARRLWLATDSEFTRRWLLANFRDALAQAAGVVLWGDGGALDGVQVRIQAGHQHPDEPDTPDMAAEQAEFLDGGA